MEQTQNEQNKPKKEKKEHQKVSAVLKNNLRMLWAVSRYSPEFPLLVILDTLLGSVDEVIFTFVSVYLLNLLDSPDVRFAQIAQAIAVAAVIYTVMEIFFRWFNDAYKPVIEQKIQYKLQGDLYRKALTLDLECYDDPAFYNDFVFAMDQAKDKGIEVVFGLENLIRKLLGVGALVSLMVSLSPPLGALLIFSSLGIVITDFRFNKLWFKKDVDEKPFHRKNSYINRVFHLSDYSKELRVSSVTGNLYREYDGAVDSIVDNEIRYGKKFLILDGISKIFTMLGTFGSLILSFFLLIKGEIALGGFAASLTVVWSLQWRMYSFFQEITNLPKRSLYIDKYFTFLRHENKIASGDGIPGDFESLEFQDVCFGYPFDKEHNFTLQNVSFTLKKGEKVAIVGYNGAGKTTLTKLILRFYDPTSGRILYNGRDVREYNLDAYRAKICALFQDFRIFAATVGQNVTFGECRPEDESRVRDALEKATFGDRLAEMEQGIDSPLTKEFDPAGINLSGGESQKIAIARILVSGKQLLIMDEPSSALDPAAEYALNHIISDSMDGQTMIFISHRLSTTKIADRIYMFSGGRLVEQGSHDQLMEQGGSYAEMFNLQASKYRAARA